MLKFVASMPPSHPAIAAHSTALLSSIPMHENACKCTVPSKRKRARRSRPLRAILHPRLRPPSVPTCLRASVPLRYTPPVFYRIGLRDTLRALGQEDERR